MRVLSPILTGPRIFAPSPTTTLLPMVGCLFPFSQVVPPEGDAVVHGHVVAHFGRLADDHAHAVVDEKRPADPGAGVYLDAGKKPPHVGDKTSEKVHLVQPEPMG